MTSSNRVLARLILLLAAVVFVSTAAAIAVLSNAIPGLSDWGPVAAASSVVLSGLEFVEATATVSAIVAAIALAAAILLTMYAVTRGRGRTSVAMTLDGEADPADRVDITSDVLRDIARAEAESALAVEKLDLHAYRVGHGRLRRSGFEASRRGGAALLITAGVRAGARPSAAHREMAGIVDRLDAALEKRVPVVVHLRTHRHTAARAE